MKTSAKTALITGATNGIGRELANCFAEDKYNLVIVARDQTELTQTAQEIELQHGVQVLPLAADLFDPHARPSRCSSASGPRACRLTRWSTTAVRRRRSYSLFFRAD